MGKNPLFSTYRQGENRVTSSMIAVFERIDVSLLEQLLAAATGETSLQMVSFTNQPAGSGASVPDALIQARFAYWFEVKTASNALRRKQLDEHIANLDGGVAEERLFVVTPDAAEPAVIAELADPRIVWFNFRALSNAIADTLADPTLLPGERTVFLLRELQALFLEDGLLDGDNTVIVAARFAYGEYLDHGAYVCQPGRRFRQELTHLGFYYKGAIQPEVPAILGVYDDVTFTRAEADRRCGSTSDVEQRVGSAIAGLLSAGKRDEGKTYEVFVLSQPDDKLTLHLEAPIVNATIDHEGKPFAWTMGQRYTNTAALTRPGVRTTADLAAKT